MHITNARLHTHTWNECRKRDTLTIRHTLALVVRGRVAKTHVRIRVYCIRNEIRLFVFESCVYRNCEIRFIFIFGCCCGLHLTPCTLYTHTRLYTAIDSRSCCVSFFQSIRAYLEYGMSVCNIAGGGLAWRIAGNTFAMV